MVCQLKNNQGYMIKVVYRENEGIKFKLRDSKRERYKEAVSIILDFPASYKSDKLQESPIHKILADPDKFGFQVQKKNGKVSVIFSSKGEERKKAIALGGIGAVVCGLAAIASAPFWVTTAAAAAVVGVASTVIIGAGIKVASYAYSTHEDDFKDNECVLESLKGGAEGLVGGACAAGGVLLTPVLGTVAAPIVASVAAGGAGEMASQILDPKWNATKIVVASAASLVSAGTGSAVRELLKKYPLDKIINKVVSVAAKSSLFSPFVSDATTLAAQKVAIKATNGALVGGLAATTKTVVKNALNGKKLDTELLANVAAGMGGVAVGDVLGSVPLDKNSQAMALKTSTVNGSSAAVRTVIKNALTGKKLSHNLASSIAKGMGSGGTKAVVKLQMPET